MSGYSAMNVTNRFNEENKRIADDILYTYSKNIGFYTYNAQGIKSVVKENYIEVKKHFFTADQKIKRTRYENIPFIFEHLNDYIYKDLVTGEKHDTRNSNNYNFNSPGIKFYGASFGYSHDEVIKILDKVTEDDYRRYKDKKDRLNELVYKQYLTNETEKNEAKRALEQKEEYIRTLSKRFK